MTLERECAAKAADSIEQLSWSLRTAYQAINRHNWEQEVRDVCNMWWNWELAGDPSMRICSYCKRSFLCPRCRLPM